MRIFLIGYMGCGKSTLGRKIASRIGLKFNDLDKSIEQEQNLSVSECFSKHGEKWFREVEHNILIETFQQDNTIIATGGGTPCFFDNMDLMNENKIERLESKAGFFWKRK